MIYLKETHPVISYETVVAYPYCICNNCETKRNCCLISYKSRLWHHFFFGGGGIIEIQLAQYIFTGMWV